MQLIDSDGFAGSALLPRRQTGALVCAAALAITLGLAPTVRAQTTPSPADLVQEEAIAKNLDLKLSVVQQIQALIADKANRTPAQQKISSHLIYAARTYQGLPVAPGVPKLYTHIKIASDGTTRVIIRVNQITNALLQAIQAAGGSVNATYPATLAVDANLPITQLETIAARTEVKNIQPPPTPRTLGKVSHKAALAPYLKPWNAAPQSKSVHIPSVLVGPLAPFGMRDLGATLLPLLLQTGSVDSEGDTVHQAITARSTYGMNGTGLNIGVLSDDDEYLQQSERTGDIPKNVTIVDSGLSIESQDGDSPTGEGTAMMQIVYDLAPGAKLFFATAYDSDDAFASNILELYNKYKCNIICDDVGYSDEPVFSDGIIAQAVNTVTAGGALYFSAAGNSGNNYSGASLTWEGDFDSGGSVSIPSIGTENFVNNFGSSSAPVLYNTDEFDDGGSGTFITLQWADAYNNVVSEYDMYSTDSTGSTLIDASTDETTGTSIPLSVVGAFQGDRIYVVKSAGGARALNLQVSQDADGAPGFSYVTTGATNGHNCAASAFGVAAAPATNDSGFGGPYPNPFTKSSPPEYFSSDGPRRVFYTVNSSGVATPISAGNYTFASGGYTSRPQPTVTASDGVSTSLAAFTPFYGTSAATPHAASIAALLWTYSGSTATTTVTGPDLTPAEIRTTLTSSALDGGPSGWDPTYGYGIVMPIPAIQFLQNFVSTSSIKATYISSGTYKITWTTNLPASSYVEYGTTSSTTSLAGTATPTTSHSVTLTGINPLLAAYYKISSATPTNSVVYLDSAARPLNSAAAANPNMIVANLQLAQMTVSGSAVTAAKITITNTGSGAANNVQITGVTLGGNSTTTTLPLTIGPLASGKSGSELVYFSQIAAGTKTTCTVTGSDGNGDTFTSTVSVQIP